MFTIEFIMIDLVIIMFSVRIYLFIVGQQIFSYQSGLQCDRSGRRGYLCRFDELLKTTSCLAAVRSGLFVYRINSIGILVSSPGRSVVINTLQ